MKIYISGKITGTSDYMQRFQSAENLLRERGFEVINPARTNATLPESTTWEQYMAVCLTLLTMCDAIYMLAGYEKSPGALMELDQARRGRLKIFYEEEEHPQKGGWELITESSLIFRDEVYAE